jgi:hypothetical protein
MPALPASAQKGADRNVKPIEGLEPLPPSPVTRWRDLPLLPWASAPFSACGLRAEDVTKRDILRWHLTTFGCSIRPAQNAAGPRGPADNADSPQIDDARHLAPRFTW